jgi:hypothetical protein
LSKFEGKELATGTFFGDIQNWFQGGYHGRHLGLVLRELGKHQPVAFASFLADACPRCDIGVRDLKNAIYETEYRFKGKAGTTRIADLAVTLEGDADPRILVEIKYFDKPLEETALKPEQFADYRYWKSANNTREVLVLSRELYLASGLVVRRWDALARHLQHYAKRSDLVQMLVEYLEGEGIVMQNVDGNSVTRYFKRLVCPKWKAGVSANNVEGPAEFSKLLKNLKLLSGSFDVYFKDAWQKASKKHAGSNSSIRAASIDFNLTNMLGDHVRLSDVVNEDGDLIDSKKAGGDIDIFAQHAMGNGNDKYLRIRYGMRFGVTPSSVHKGNVKAEKSTSPTCHLYAYARARKIEDSSDYFYEKKIDFSLVTDIAAEKTDRVDKYLHELVLRVISEVDNAALPFEAVQLSAIKQLRRSLAAKNPPQLA